MDCRKKEPRRILRFSKRRVEDVYFIGCSKAGRVQRQTSSVMLEEVEFWPLKEKSVF